MDILSSFRSSSGITPRTVRVISGAIFINTFGGALGSAALVIFLVNVQGFPPTEIAAFIFAAACAGFVTAGVLGWVGDVLGGRGTLQVYLVGMGFATFALVFVSESWQLAVALIAFYVLDRGVSGIAAGLVATVVEPEYRAEARGLTRTYALLGSSLGYLAAVPLIAGVGAMSLQTAIIVDGITYFVAAAVYFLLPKEKVTGSHMKSRPWTALHDWRFIAVSALACLAALFVPLFTFALPLWLPMQNHVPLSLLPVLMLISNVSIMFIQVPASRRFKTTANAKVGVLIGGIATSLAFLLIWLTAHAPVGLSIALMVVATLAFAAGRAVLTATQWTVAYESANEHAQGQYQSVFGTVLALAIAIGPSLYGATVELPSGWLILAGLALVVGLISYAGLRVFGRRAETAEE